MSNQLIVIEGPDNTGKSALVSQLAKTFMLNNDVLLMHSTKPTKSSSPEAMLLFQSLSFLKQAQKIIALCDEKFSSGDNIIIMDRAWYGEYVYGQIYRNENPDEIVKMINDVDDYLYSFNIKRATILTTASPEFVLKKDDRNSFFSSIEASKKIEAITKEISMFNECFDKTLKKNKFLKNTFMTLNVEGENMRYVAPSILLETTLDFIKKTSAR